MNALASRRLLLRPVLALVFAASLVLPCSPLWGARADSALAAAPGDADEQAFPNRKISNVTFVAFDTETTGLNPRKDRIVELAAVKFRNGEIVEEKTWLINPDRSMPHWAQRIHGITTDMVKDQPRFANVYPEFEAFIKGSVLLAHNAPFDIGFLNEELKRSGLAPPSNLVIDSLGLFRTWFPTLKSHSLQAVAKHLEVDKEDFHRALADSMYVALIFEKGARKFDDTARLRDVYADAGGPLKF